jgi:hypothetical protein
MTRHILTGVIRMIVPFSDRLSQQEASFRHPTVNREKHHPSSYQNLIDNSTRQTLHNQWSYGKRALRYAREMYQFCSFC